MSYSQPVNSKRPAKSDRFDVFSPKLDRALTLYSYPQLHQWVLLEAMPSVTSFCERPAILTTKDKQTVLIDFWLQSTSREAFLILQGNDTPIPNLDGRPPCRIIRVKPRHLARWTIFALNWQPMLPYIVAHRRWLSGDDMSALARVCKAPMTLKEN